MRLRSVAVWGFIAFFPFIAPAQSQRTFVSAAGADTNPCSRSAPCRNFAAAVAQTLSGGEVVVLDSAGYGPVSITQGVSLVAPPGVYAGVAVLSGDGITIDATGAVVRLAGLTINGLGGSNGVTATNAGAIYVEGCLMSGFTGAGLNVTTGGDVIVHDSIARENGSGFWVYPSGSGIAMVSFDHCRAERNTVRGYFVRGPVAGTKAVVADSYALDNRSAGGSLGIEAYGMEMNVEGCVVSNNDYGLYATGGASLAFSNTTVTDNTTYGLYNNGVMDSYGNNRVHGNGNNNVVFPTAVVTISQQ